MKVISSFILFMAGSTLAACNGGKKGYCCNPQNVAEAPLGVATNCISSKSAANCQTTKNYFCCTSVTLARIGAGCTLQPGPSPKKTTTKKTSTKKTSTKKTSAKKTSTRKTTTKKTTSTKTTSTKSSTTVAPSTTKPTIAGSSPTAACANNNAAQNKGACCDKISDANRQLGIDSTYDCDRNVPPNECHGDDKKYYCCIIIEDNGDAYSCSPRTEA